MNGNDTFLDVNDAHLRVTSGNVYASAFNLDQIDIVMSSNTASTVNFNNPTKAFNAASNIEVGTANLFVDTTTTRVGVGTASPATTLDVAGDLNVSGNLTIIGTTTTLDTDHLRVKDPIIELGKDNTASPGVDLGLVMTRPSGSSNVGIIFDESATRLEIGYTQGTASDSTITMDSTPLSVNVNGTISGNGSGLTALNAANITTGTLDRNTTGSAATLTTPRTIGGVNFDGSADIVPTTFGAATFDTDTLVVDSVNDRVGVGTNGPGGKLDIRGSVSDPSIPTVHIGDNAADFGDYGMVNLVRNPAESGTKAHLAFIRSGNTIFSQGYYNNTNTFGFWPSFSSVANTPAMAFATNGNVGIGTADPIGTLSVVRDTVVAGASTYQRGMFYKDGKLQITPPDLYNGYPLDGDFLTTSRYLTDGSTDYTGAALGVVYDTVAGSKSALYFKTAVTASSLTEKMRITGDGNVGIGTTSPDCNLEIYGDTSSIKLTRSRNNTNYGCSVEFALLNSANEKFTYGRLSGSIADNTDGSEDGFLSFQVGTNGNMRSNYEEEKMRILSNGNVGIGTSSPESSLEVHGTGIHINGTVLRSNSGMGAMTGGQWYKVCDFSALPATVVGVCAIRIKWSGGSLTNAGTYYWSGHASGIVPYNTYGDGNGIYTAAPSEPLTLNQSYHHRTPGAFEFILDGDGSGGSYGRQSIYIKTPQSLSNLSLEVIAMPLRR